jgi:hypothetical protein
MASGQRQVIKRGMAEEWVAAMAAGACVPLRPEIVDSDAQRVFAPGFVRSPR